MKKLTADLWQSTLHNSGMLSSHAYFLTTNEGNFLLYNTANEQDLAQIETLGGIDYQLLTHRDEAAPSLSKIKQRFGSQLVCSDIERPFVNKHCDVDIALASDQSNIGAVEVLATPGHTDGSLCFYYRSPTGNHYLFTGDTLFQWERSWATLVLSNAGGSAESLEKSLSSLKHLTPDYVISSGFVSEEAYVKIERHQWTDILAGAIANI